MSAPLRDRYQARIDELESLSRELKAQSRPGDAGPVVGRVLEAAGDLLRRRAAFSCDDALLDGALGLLPPEGVASWAAAVAADELLERVGRAAQHAVEAAFPESDEDAATWVSWAMADLQARDRLESALAALERLAGNGGAGVRPVVDRLRELAQRVDRSGRPSLPALTALNDARRAEAALLDESARAAAWWYCARILAEDDGVVTRLGSGNPEGLSDVERAVHEAVTAPRRRRTVGFDELLRLDLGQAPAVEIALLRNQARVDPDLALALAAMVAGEQAIAELDGPGEGLQAPTTAPERPAPQIAVERPQFRLLLLRSPSRLQVVAQPRDGARLAAAAVHLSYGPPLDGVPGAQGLEIDLGTPERHAGRSVRVVVRLASGQVVTSEVLL